MGRSVDPSPLIPAKAGNQNAGMEVLDPAFAGMSGRGEADAMRVADGEPHPRQKIHCRRHCGKSIGVRNGS